MKTAYEAGKEYSEWGWSNVILPRIERMLEMTEHVHEWEWNRIMYVCKQEGCDEFRTVLCAQDSLNATERFTAKDARADADGKLWLLNVGDKAVAPEDMPEDYQKLIAYADILEGK